MKRKLHAIGGGRGMWSLAVRQAVKVNGSTYERPSNPHHGGKPAEQMTRSLQRGGARCAFAFAEAEVQSAAGRASGHERRQSSLGSSTAAYSGGGSVDVKGPSGVLERVAWHM